MMISQALHSTPNSYTFGPLFIVNFVLLIYVTFSQLYATSYWTSKREGNSYRGIRAMSYSFSNETSVFLHSQCIALMNGTSV